MAKMNTRTALLAAVLIGSGVMIAAISSVPSADRTEDRPPSAEVHGLMLANHGPGTATITWDEHGAPIITAPLTDDLARRLDALSRPRQCLGGVIYEATFVVGSRESIPASQIGSEAGGTRADLLDIIQTLPTRRPDTELHRLLNKVDLSGISICRADGRGKVHPLGDIGG